MIIFLGSFLCTIYGKQVDESECKCKGRGRGLGNIIDKGGIDIDKREMNP
jgi:hypothetical protein